MHQKFTLPHKTYRYLCILLKCNCDKANARKMLTDSIAYSVLCSNLASQYTVIFTWWSSISSSWYSISSVKDFFKVSSWDLVYNNNNNNHHHTCLKVNTSVKINQKTRILTSGDKARQERTPLQQPFKMSSDFHKKCTL